MKSFLSQALATGFAASLAFAFAVPARAEAPFSFDAVPGRLPKAVVPIDYDIAVVPDIAAKTFTGSETVVVTVREPVQRFTLNIKEMTIASAVLDGKTKAAIALDPAKQQATLDWKKTVPAGPHKVALVFSGKIGQAAEGLFYQKYRTPSGVEKTMLSTQFESTDARRMFPSWDEPSYRATFRLRATIPENFTAVSNMPIVDTLPGAKGTKIVQFARTPKMASYLVVLSAGEFEKMEGAADGVKIDVYATEGKRDSEAYALQSAQKILAYYDEYFGVKFPLPKLSLIAVPGGFGGAMENWGGITFNEQILLWDAKTRPETAKQGIFSVIAHEMAHQWFGDLVTMAWWDNLWLNEGFASWMGTKATDRFNPDWNSWQRANSEKNQALASDARKTSHPIQQPIANETEADAAFDEITYLKGQSFLRMLEQYLGEEKFRTGIRSYMAQHKYSNTTTADLWASLGTASGLDVAKFASAWTEQAGYPVVGVAATCANGTRTLQLTQQRYFTDNAQTSDQLWEVPLAIEIGANDPAYTLLTAKQATIPGGSCTSSLVINGKNVGFYRVRYDATLQETLQKNLASLSADDKLAILSDTAALAQSGRIPMGQSLSLYSAIGAETNLAVWEQVLGSLGSAASLEYGSKGQPKFDAYARDVLRPTFDKLGGWDGPKGDSSTEQLRTDMIGALGAYGDTAVIAEARKRYAAYKADPASLSIDKLGAVLGIVGRYADAATWDELHASARNARTVAEKQRYYGAMLAATNPELAKKNLAIATSGEIPPETATFALRIVGAVAGANPRLAYEFYKANREQLQKPLSQFEKTLGAAGLISAFWNAAPADELEAFAKANTSPEAYPQIAKAMEQVQQRKDQQTRLVPQIDGYTDSLSLIRK